MDVVRQYVPWFVLQPYKKFTIENLKKKSLWNIFTIALWFKWIQTRSVPPKSFACISQDDLHIPEMTRGKCLIFQPIDRLLEAEQVVFMWWWFCKDDPSKHNNDENSNAQFVAYEKTIMEVCWKEGTGIILDPDIDAYKKVLQASHPSCLSPSLCTIMFYDW